LCIGMDVSLCVSTMHGARKRIVVTTVTALPCIA
jgi:hypothetical protein